jgi:hypothetical protein
MRATLLISILMFFGSGFARAGALPRPGAATTPIESAVHFSLASTDGSLQYDCKHWIANPGAGDLTVICGKGTTTVKQYSVHFLVRTQPHGPAATSFEVLYWVTDRNVVGKVPGFSSHSQYFTVENQTQIREFTMSEGVENDTFQLTVHYRP